MDSPHRTRHRLALPLGYELGSYEFQEQLGFGSFGITYLAFDRMLSRKVAIKELLPTMIATRCETIRVESHSPEDEDQWLWAQDCFIAEAQTLAQCEHPNVLHVFEAFRANGTAYMVTRFEEGCTLTQWLKALDRPPIESELRGILDPLLSALQTVHAHQFLHRDIKPDNIYISLDHGPILIDFGSARQTVTHRSMPMTAIVTEGYAPFEQYSENGRQGPWTDLYALAAVLYSAIVGQKPPTAVERAASDGEVPCLCLERTYASDYSLALLRSIDAGLRLKPQSRPQNTEEWQQILAGSVRIRPEEPAIAAPESATPSHPLPPLPPPPPSTTHARDRGGAFKAVMVMALLLLGAAVVFLLVALKNKDASLREAARSTHPDGEATPPAEEANKSDGAQPPKLPVMPDIGSAAPAAPGKLGNERAGDASVSSPPPVASLAPQNSASPAAAAATNPPAAGHFPAAADSSTVNVGVVRLLSDAAQVKEQSLVDILLFAFDEINAHGGVLGKKIKPIVIDNTWDPPHFAEDTRALLEEQRVAVSFGSADSTSRKSGLRIFEKDNGLLFYPARFEGEEPSKNVFYTAETVNQQALPAVDYLLAQGKKKFYLLGTDYAYARTTNLAIAEYLRSKGIPLDNIGGGKKTEPGAGSPPVAKATPSTEANRRKLARIIIPKVEFYEATIREALDFLHKKSIELDDSSPPGEKGFNIILKLEGDDATPSLDPSTGNPAASSPPGARVTASLTNIPLGEALRYVTELANLKMRVEPNGIAVARTFDSTYQPATAEHLVASQTTRRLPPGKEQLRHKLERLVIPKLEFREATIREAFDFLRKKSVELDDLSPAGEKGVNFILKLEAGAASTKPSNVEQPLPGIPPIPGLETPPNSPPTPNPSDARITISLTNVPFIEAVRYVSWLANAKFSVDTYAVAIEPALAPAPAPDPGQYTPFGHLDFYAIVAEIKRFAAGGQACVISTLNGDNNIPFYLAYTDAGLTAKTCPVVNLSISEEEYRSLRPSMFKGQLGCWTYFQSIESTENKKFVAGFQTWLHNTAAPGVVKDGRVTCSPMVLSYDSVYLWKAAVEKAGSFEVDKVIAALESGTSFQGPGGTVTTQKNHYLTKNVYIGETQADGQFKILQEYPDVSGGPYLKGKDPKPGQEAPR